MTPNSKSMDETASATATQSIGAYLTQLRLSQTISLKDASMRTKYSVPQLEALEQDEWEKLPSGAPLRWMVKSYGQYLGANVDLLFSLLGSQGQTASLGRATSLHHDVANNDMSLETEPKQRVVGWLIVIAVLLLAALFYALNQGLIPESWLIFDWLKELKS